MNKPLDTQELPPLPKPMMSSKHWDSGIEWSLAGERAVRLEREDQLREALSRISQLEKENAALYSALSDLVDGIEDAGGHDENGDVFAIEDAVSALEMHEKRLPSPPKEAL